MLHNVPLSEIRTLARHTTEVHMVRFRTGTSSPHGHYCAILGSALEDAMPRFFFHIRSNGNGRSCDDLGLDFPSVETACSEALRAAQDLKVPSQLGARIHRTMPSRSRMKQARSCCTSRSPRFLMI
jgi:hypothetical protein